MKLRLELVTVPVSDVDRAKAFYVDQVGFNIEQDVHVDEEHRFVELMPPGSPCSIALTTGYVDSEPGSIRGIQLNVDDMDDVHAFLRDRDVDVSEIQEYPWGRFCFFSDPDGNGWSVHEPSLRIAGGGSDAGSPPAPGTTAAGVAACRATLIDFLSAIDHGHATKALDLFTPDASFAARGQQLHGQQAISSFLHEREAETDRHTVHVVTNDVVRSANDDEIVLSAMLLLHERGSDGRYAIRRALDTTQTFRRDRDRWRIRDRSTRPMHPPAE